MNWPELFRSFFPSLRRRYEADFVAAVAEFEEEVRLAREAGMLLEPAEFRTKPVPPEDENASTYLRKLGKIVEANPKLAELARNPGALAEFAAVACDQEEAVSAAWQASIARGGCDFGWNWEQGPEMSFQGLAQVRDAVHILCATARVLAMDGRFEDTHRLLAAALRIADFFADDPVLITHLLRIGCEVAALRSLCAVVFLMPRAEDQIAELRLFTSEIHSQDIAKALRGEATYGYLLSKRTSPPVYAPSGNAKIDAEFRTHPLPANTDWYRGVAARRIAAMRRVYEAAKQPVRMSLTKASPLHAPWRRA